MDGWQNLRAVKWPAEARHDFGFLTATHDRVRAVFTLRYDGYCDVELTWEG